MTEDDRYLQYLAYVGAEQRYGRHNIDANPEIERRLEHELETIRTAGFSGYFLVVADIMRFCREAGIPTGPGRGSVCGSAVAYAVGITDVDPLRFDIPFERFLHLERVAQPDVDIDLCQARRAEVIDYLRNTYGRDNVAQIITFTPMNAKGVVRDVCRVLHVDDHLHGSKSNTIGDELAKMIPDGSGADQVTLTEWMEDPKGEEFKEKISQITVPYKGREISLLDTCLRLEGIKRHGGVHAAGVVVADRPLIDIVPLYKKNKEAEVQIQYDMRDAEEIGLLKMDVLGLRTVTVIGDAEKLIQRKHPEFTIKGVPLDDAKTYQLLQLGHTGAVFQLEGEGITAACRGMRPDNFEDIIALIALYRPGPMEQLGDYFRRKHGEDEVSYAHPELESILGKTYGLIVYQEQVMAIVRTFGGYTAGEADMFRKAIGKKLVDLITEEINKFKQRAIERGYDEAFINSIGDLIFFFGRYGFNRGHAVGYAFITYWTAYLKANFPLEFFTANLNSQIGTLDKISVLLRDAQDNGINILPPDINESGEGFTLVDGSIRFGLGAVKGLGDMAIADIIAERDHHEKNEYSSKRVTRSKEDGTEYQTSIKVTKRVDNNPHPFSGLYNFCARLPHITITAKKNLITAGAFDAWHPNRAVCYQAVEECNKAAKSRKAYDVNSLTEADFAPISETEMLSKEKEVLGFYVSQHPLSLHREAFKRLSAATEGSFDALPYECAIGGLVSTVKTHTASNGEMAWVTLDNDVQGMPRITIFASNWKEAKAHMKPNAPVVVIGKRDKHAKFGVGFKVSDVIPLNAIPKHVTVGIRDADISDVLGLREYAAVDGASLAVALNCNGRVVLLQTSMKIAATPATLRGLEGLGYLVNTGNQDTDTLQWFDTRLNKTSPFKGSGAERTAAADLPLVKSTIKHLQARFVAEYK